MPLRLFSFEHLNQTPQPPSDYTTGPSERQRQRTTIAETTKLEGLEMKQSQATRWLLFCVVLVAFAGSDDHEA